jgi:CDP-glucose 4,6-dehydratase
MRLERLKNLSGPILVTGHTGFKGTWLMLLLEKLSIEAVGVSLPPEKDSLYSRAGMEGRHNEYFQDIRDSHELSRIFGKVAPSAIIHLAAKSLVIDAYEYPFETFTSNVSGTINVLDAARNTSSVLTVGAVTTDKVYENLKQSRPFLEQDKISGNEPYSSSKAAMEMVVLGWQQLFHQYGGMYPVSLRAGNVIGGGDFSANRLLPDVVRALNTTTPIQVRNPSSVRPWQHVLDPLYGYLLALEWTISGNTDPAFNFGPAGGDLEVQQVVDIACSAWAEKRNEVEVRYVESEYHESEFLALDSKYAQKTLGWSSQYSQESAIKSTIDWWKSALNDNTPPRELCIEEIENYLLKL